MKRRITAIISAIAITLGLTACGGSLVETDDKRPSIFISIFNGGYGREWIDRIVADYNEARPDNKYKISIRSSKDEFSAISSAIQSGTAIFDMFYSNAQVYRLIDGNYLEDVSDVWDSKPEGSERTIRQMMRSSDDYATAYGDGKGGIYAIPHYESVRGFVYDHELFLKYGLLYGEDGNFISSPTDTLSKGKDGIAGTYDDGHPTTEDEWEDMVIKANRIGYAFGYTGKFSLYLNDIYYAIAAQYDGADNFVSWYSVDGEYDFDDGNGTVKITPENGYLLAKMKGRKVALDFMDKYLALKDSKLGIQNAYVYPNSSTLSYSHTDAQTDFITFTARNKEKKIAMLVEGDWWENESREVFNDLAAMKYDAYAFRTHEYGFMTLPRFDGQKEDVNVYSIPDSEYLALKKQTDPEKKAICKDFMTFAYQEKYLSAYTVLTGGVMPYDVPLSEEQKAQLSPFTKRYLELYSDRTHNKFVNPLLYENEYITARGGLRVVSSNGEHYVVINGLYYYSADDYYNKLIANTESNWETTLTGYREYLAARV